MTPRPTPQPTPHDRDGEEPRVVVRDKRRVDSSGAVRAPDPDPVEPAVDPVLSPAADAVGGQLAELTETLQRVKAEYDNYRRRTDRERLALADIATASVLAQLIPVLDDIERARTHGDLTGAFGAVGDALVALSTKLGLESYGTAGEPFDPQVHEAVMAAPAAQGTDVALAAQVFRPGYRFAGRVLRAAQVAVADPAGTAAPVADPDPVGDGVGAGGEQPPGEDTLGG